MLSSSEMASMSVILIKKNKNKVKLHYIFCEVVRYFNEEKKTTTINKQTQKQNRLHYSYYY